MRISVDKQTQGIIEGINAVPEQINQAVCFAINRTADWLKSNIAKEVSAKKCIRLKIIRDRIKLRKATKKETTASLNLDASAIYARDLGIASQNKIGVKVGGKIFPHAFIAKLKPGSKEGIYVRKTRRRFPVKRVTIPIIEETQKVIENFLGQEAAEFFNKRFNHEIKRITGAA